MILNPTIDEDDAIGRLLGAAGISDSRATPLSKTLESAGATVENAARSLNALLFDDNPSARLNAVKLTLQAHGLLNEERSTSPVINISIGGENSRSLISILAPRSAR